jgi:TolA-binding protein
MNCWFYLGRVPRLFSAAGLAVLLCSGWGSSGRAAEETDADAAFAAAVRFFQGGWYDRAEKEFTEFLAGYPHSTNRNEAVLLQAQCRFQLKDFDGVVSALQEPLKTPGPWNDRYLYWLAEAQVQQERFELAAQTYAELLKAFPNSSLALAASYGEAYARFKLGETAQVVGLLKDPAGVFQRAAKGSTNQAVLVRGTFLLAEALFTQRNFAAAEQTLTELAQRGLTPETEWQRQFLLARIEVADQRGSDALLRVTNLVSIAGSTSNALLRAKSLSLKAEILQSNQPDAAAQTYEEIRRIQGLSTEESRQALLKLVELTVAHNQLGKAVQEIDTYLKENPQEQTSDLMRLTLGEIYLKQFYASSASAARTNGDADLSSRSNLLHSARAEFDRITTQLTNSPYLGKACLDRGWTFWEEAQMSPDPALLTESTNAFSAAVAHLPKSYDRALARFKLADACVALKNDASGISQYQRLLSEDKDSAEAREKLFDRAQYQIVRASIDAGDLRLAQSSVAQLQHDFPKSPQTEQANYLLGQAFSDNSDFARANQTFAEFEQTYPNSSLLPKVRLALGRSFARQAKWLEATRAYEQWLSRYPTNEARPEAEFNHAWCLYQAGAETNAFNSFTNLIQQFPSSAFAPLARLWVADYYLNARDYERADINYQFLFNSTNAAPADLANQARLMAAKACFFRQAYLDATKYLTNLLYDAQVGPEAWFMLGDIELEDPSRSSTNKVSKFEEAIKRYQRIVTLFPNSRLVPSALGKIADCHFQLAPQDPSRYDMATNQYAQAIAHPLADSNTRNAAEVGLGRVLETMAELRTNRVDLLHEALRHYLNVVYRVQKAEDLDPFWLKEAALRAGSLAAEKLNAFDEAEHLYQSMMVTLPSFKPLWEKRLANLRQSHPR